MKPVLFTVAMMLALSSTVYAADDDSSKDKVDASSIFRGKSPKDFTGAGPNSWKT